MRAYSRGAAASSSGTDASPSSDEEVNEEDMCEVQHGVIDATYDEDENAASQKGPNHTPPAYAGKTKRLR